MTRFTQDNTGYSDADLTALNAAFKSIMSNARTCTLSYMCDDVDELKALEDWVAERLLANYDEGWRGEALLGFWKVRKEADAKAFWAEIDSWRS